MISGGTSLYRLERHPNKLSISFSGHALSLPGAFAAAFGPLLSILAGIRRRATRVSQHVLLAAIVPVDGHRPELGSRLPVAPNDRLL